MGIILIDIDTYKDLHKKYVQSQRRVNLLLFTQEILERKVARLTDELKRERNRYLYDGGDIFGDILKGIYNPK